MSDQINQAVPTIEPAKDGPLKVTRLKTFRNSRGDPIATRKAVYLCRCGASKNKPFCDGTHSSIGFRDEKSPERLADRLDDYRGQDLTIRDNRGACAHAGFCSNDLPSVWRLGVEPWIDPDGAGKDEILRTIRRCPSGALATAEESDAGLDQQDSPEIRIARDGPYHVRGAIELKDVAFGAGVNRQVYALCRCGASRNKPFCDGSHWYAGFRDDESRTISAVARAGEAGEDAWVAVGAMEDFQVGRVHGVTVGERQVALVRGEAGWRLSGACDP